MTFFKNNKIFVIAEMANSHEGNFDNAKEITRKSALAGADAIKYQKFSADELAKPDHENYQLYKKLEMKDNEWSKLIKFAKNQGLKVFVDIFGIKNAKQITKHSVDGFKIHSADLANPQMLEYLSKSKKPILISAAGCLVNELDEAIKKLQKIPKEVVLMHGFQGYPTKLKDLNLERISNLKNRYSLPVGISDHVNGELPIAKQIPLVGIGLGARIVEKHIILDRSKKGLDHYSSLNPDEFKEMTISIRQIEKSLGTSDFVLGNSELQYRLNHKKNPIAKFNIKKGTKLDHNLFEFKRTKIKKSVSYYEFKEKIAKKDISKGTTLTPHLIEKPNKKIAAIIACRVDSLRLYAKPLQFVNKFRILELLLEQISKSSLIDEIILAISDKPGNEAFINFAQKRNIKFITGDDEDVLKRLILATNYVEADIVFRVTSDNPFI